MTYSIPRFLKLGAATALVAFASTVALADTIQIGSYATGASAMGNANTALNFAGFSSTSTTPSTGTGTTFTLNPGSTWGAALANSTWVGSTATSGPGNTVNPAMGYYTYTTTFNGSSAAPYSGSISVMADDTAEVLLNGNLVFSFGMLGADSHCAAGSPSCSIADTVGFSGASLLNGLNTLTFVVQQAGNIGAAGQDPSGLDFDATLSTGAVPEPSTLALMAIGMAGIGGAVLLRKPELLKS
jgi:hypothetical protein